MLYVLATCKSLFFLFFIFYFFYYLKKIIKTWVNIWVATFLNFSQLSENVFRPNFPGKHFPENQAKFSFD